MIIRANRKLKVSIILIFCLVLFTVDAFACWEAPVARLVHDNRPTLLLISLILLPPSVLLMCCKYPESKVLKFIIGIALFLLMLSFTPINKSALCESYENDEYVIWK